MTITASQIGEQYPVKAKTFLADVTSFVAMRQAASEIHTSFGRADHIVFAVAIGSGKYGFPFWNLEAKEDRR